MKNLIIFFSFVFSLNVLGAGLEIVDLQNNRARFPIPFVQIRQKLVQLNNEYDFYGGDLTLYCQINETKMCLEFSTDYALNEMRKRIETNLVSPPGSSIPSVIEIHSVNSCQCKP